MCSTFTSRFGGYFPRNSANHAWKRESKFHFVIGRLEYIGDVGGFEDIERNGYFSEFVIIVGVDRSPALQDIIVS